jgi:hypothetical protein
MAKVSRTPYNGARYVTRQVNKSVTLNSKMTGEAVFVTADGAITVDIPFFDNGAYFRIILRDSNVGALTLTFTSVSGVVFSDDGVSTTSTTYEDAQSIEIPAGRAAGSFVDVICDGARWYAQGLMAPAQ